MTASLLSAARGIPHTGTEVVPARPTPLARFAIRHRTGPCGWLRATTGHSEVRFTLSQAVDWMRRTGFAEGDAADDWLRVYAGAPDAVAQTYLRRLLGGHAPQIPAAEVAAWSALGTLGPSVFAAGLTPVEAVERNAAGSLDGDALTMLIALRGWRLLLSGCPPILGA